MCRRGEEKGCWKWKERVGHLVKKGQQARTYETKGKEEENIIKTRDYCYVFCACVLILISFRVQFVFLGLRRRRRGGEVFD